MKKYIDINSDVGERPEALANGTEEQLIKQITSANIACGGHAGDEDSMIRVMRLCVLYGVGIGAHPSYPDRITFGRKDMKTSTDDITEFVYRQVSLLDKLSHQIGFEVRHVKPHGALYLAASKDENVALAIARGVAQIRREIALLGLANSKALDVWRHEGFAAVGEAFADRRYESDGSLRPRHFEDSLISDPKLAARQAFMIAKYGKVLSVTGEEISLDAQTICIHSDTLNSAEIAEEIRLLLAKNGFIITPF